MPRRPAAPSVPAAVAPPTAPALIQVDSDSDSSQPGPAILISPVKAQAAKQGIANKSDKDVWSLPDNDIIEASKATWGSSVYDHFDITIRCEMDARGRPKMLS
ncbi:hypothetical protein L208DRAFT_1305289, partial [Tricholoma matsutake]